MCGHTCECKDGFYMSDDFQSCIECSEGCKICENENDSSVDNKETCTKCHEGRDPKNNCECELHKFPTNEECKECHVTCKTCTGERDNECEDCYDATFNREKVVS